MVRKQLKPRINICRNEDVSLISNEQEILKRMVRHFDKLLNGRNVNECVTFTTTSNNQILKGKTQVTIDAPITEDIETALKKWKNNKAPGTDNVPAELLKFGSDRLKQWLKHLFSSIWISEENPNDWLQVTICPLHMKGDQSEYANYRGIALLNVTCKVFSNILYTRLLPNIRSKFGYY